MAARLRPNPMLNDIYRTEQAGDQPARVVCFEFWRFCFEHLPQAGGAETKNRKIQNSCPKNISEARINPMLKRKNPPPTPPQSP